MKKLILIATSALILALVLGLGQAVAQDISKLKYPKLNKLEIPEIERVTLDNGIRLYLLPDRSLPVFRVSARINCGSYLDPAEKIGLAAFCGTVMRSGGTEKWTGDELDELLEGIGGSVETSIGDVSGNASVRVLSEFTDLGLEVMAEVLRRPVFSEDKLDLAKVQERSAISRRNDEPFQALIREFRKKIYGENSPYALHTEYATVNAISREDLIEYHRSYINPENVQMAVWGDFDTEEIVSKITAYFGDWQRGTQTVPAPPPIDYAFDQKVYVIDKPDAKQAYILMGHIGGLLTDDDYADRIVMNSILGGSFGSRLVDNVRSKQGLAYTTQGAFTSDIKRPGLFYLYASTKPETMSQAVKEMIKQARSMQTDPPTDIEMKKGKDGYLNSFVFKFDSKSEVVNRLMNYDFHGLPEDLVFQQKEAVENVSKNDVVAAAVKNLHPDQMRIMVLGNTAQFDMPAEQLDLGSVEVIDITIPTGEEERELAVTPENLAKGKEILEQAVAAAGGLEAFKAVASVSVKATLTLSMQGQEFPLKIESLDVLPDKSRSVVNFMGRQLWDIRNGETGWRTNQMTMQLEEKTAEDIKADDVEQARNLTMIYQHSGDPYYQAVYDGQGKVEGRAVEYVVLLDSEGETICRLGYDAGDHSLVSRSYWGQAPTGEGTIEEQFSDVREVGGIKVAFSRVSSLNGQKVTQLDIEEYLLNGDVPADAFDKPAE